MNLDNQPILKDFDRFITYICDKPHLALTNDKGVLKSIDLTVLNESMTSFRTDFVTSKFQQRVFSLLNTFFHIALAGEFFDIRVDAKGKKYATIQENRISEYDSLSDTEKYFFLLEAFWCHIDWDEVYDCRNFWEAEFYKNLAKRKVNQIITISDRDLKRDGEVEGPSFYFVAEIFKAFGFIDLSWDDKLSSRPTKYVFPYKDITLLPLGEIMLSVLVSERPQYKWHKENQLLSDFIFSENDEENENPDIENFEDAFLPFLEGIKIEKHLLPHPIKLIIEHEYIKGCYYLKVALDKNLYRTIALGSQNTFDDLHLAIQEAFDFDNDHLYAFFMDNKRWSRSGTSYWSPHNDEGIMADAVRVGAAKLREGMRFLYLFDFGDEWHFEITVLAIKEYENELATAKVIESVGENPQQYPDWEDEEEDEDDD